MSGSILFYDPSAFTAYQNCTCKYSRMVDDARLEQSKVDAGGKVTVTITQRPKVCSVCGKPYRIMVDSRRVGIITGLAE